MGKKWWQKKPFRNTMGVVPKAIVTGRTITHQLLPRVERLVAGGVIPKPLWLAAAHAHPPPLEHKFMGPRPQRFEWREEDRLRRTWQRRNPEASMHPKVLFLDETQLPAGTKTEHPADEFVSKQLRLMRHQGLSEAEAYRRVAQGYRDERRVADDEVAAARAQARAFGATPAQEAEQPQKQQQPSPPKQDSFATRLLRRFAEEAKSSGEAYPRHWFAADGTWKGIGLVEAEMGGRTMRDIKRHGIRAAVDEAAKAEAEATARMHELRFNEAEEDGDFQAAVRAQEDAESAKGEPSGASTETGEPTKP